MTYEIKLKKSVEKAVTKWKKSNPRLHKKFKEILYELLEHPRTGIGHPEALIGGNDIRWSRHVTHMTGLSTTSMMILWWLR